MSCRPGGGQSERESHRAQGKFSEMKRRWIASIAACGLLAGCIDLLSLKSEPPLPVYTPAPPADITRSSYQATDALMEQFRGAIATDAPVIVATVVDLNTLEDSSPLGRLMTEQISGRLSQSGVRVVEVKLRNQLYIRRNEGELMLSRELRDIGKRHNASVAVTGTYTDSRKRVFVNLKAIRLDDAVVLGSVDYHLERDALVRSLLDGGKTQGTILK